MYYYSRYWPFKSSRLRNERVSIIGDWVLMVWAEDTDDDDEDGEDDDDTVDDCSTIVEVGLCGGAGSISWGYYKTNEIVERIQKRKYTHFVRIFTQRQIWTYFLLPLKLPLQEQLLLLEK